MFAEVTQSKHASYWDELLALLTSGSISDNNVLPHWDGAKLHPPLISRVNGSLFGKPNAG
jgi:hypothetical protein